MTTNISNVFGSSGTSRVVTRFAPSPTGFMHIGNLRTALFSYLFAKNTNGIFLLRIEDTDQERSKAEYIEGLFKDFKALGIMWDQEVIYQSERIKIYEEFYTKLKQQNLIYPCFCSEQKLNLSRKLQLSKGIPPRYNGDCLKLSIEDINKKLINNELACLRFKIPKDVLIEFEDLIKGKQIFNSNAFGDFIIKRQDGSASFMFCSVIDDVLQGVTHILRGEDHLSNTPRQLLILQVLGLTPPRYGHFPLLASNTTNNIKLSKRSGDSGSIQTLLQQGYLSEALLNYLARLGHHFEDQGNKLFNLSELATYFNLQNISTHTAKHDMVHLDFWQKQAMLAIDNQKLIDLLVKEVEFKQILTTYKINGGLLDQCITLIKNNIIMPKETIEWFKILFSDNINELTFNPDLHKNFQTINIKFITILIDKVFVEVFEFTEICNKLQELGFSKKEIFINLRIICTGKTFGPELNRIFEIMGKDRIIKRTYQIIDLITNL